MSELNDELVQMSDEPNDNVIALAKTRTTVDPKAEVDVELGVSSGLPFVGYQEYISGAGYAALSSSTITVEQLIEMRQKDGTARALMRLLSLPIRSALKDAEWIEPEEGGATQETEFANEMFSLPPASGGMTTPLSKVVRDILLSMTEGFSAFEEVRHVPDKGPLKGKVTLKKLAHRDSRTIKFIVDDQGGFKGIRQLTNINGKQIDVFIPKEKAWYYAVNEEENPFYGVSMFESAWYHFDAKRKLYYIAHVAAQIAAVPGRVGELPPQATNAQIQAFKKALADFAFNTSMLAPAGFKVTPFSGNSGFDFLKLIDHHDMQMSKSVLAKFLGEEAKPVLIDNNTNAADGADFFVMALETIMNEIADNLSYYLMPKYIDWNFGTQKYPEFRFGILSDSTKDVIKDLFSIIATAQSSQWTAEFIRELEKKLTERLGLEVDYEEVAAREEKEKAEQLAFQQQYYGAQQGGAVAGEGAAPAEGGASTATPAE